MVILCYVAFMWRRQQVHRDLKFLVDPKKARRKYSAEMLRHEAKLTRADVLKFAIDRGHRWRIPKVAILKAEAELAKEQDKYTYFDAFLDIVEDGDIKLLRGSWLANEANMIRFRRQQDIMAQTPGAFWEVKELRSQIEFVHFVIISYCWLHPVNPDPESKHLKVLQYAIKKRLEVRGEGKVQDIAIVVDYLSLAQHGEMAGEDGKLFRSPPQADPGKQRTEAENRQFNTGLGLLNIPYAHREVQVWLMPWTPEGHTEYMNRGWPFFEQAVAGLVKNSTKLISLTPEVVAERKTWDEIVEQSALSHRRVPPLLPSLFEEEIMARTFTNGKNAQVFVAGLYKRTFEEVIGHATVLWFVDLAWGDADAEKLGEILGACKKLKQLLVTDNPIRKSGATALVKAASDCKTLELLDMTGNAMSRQDCLELHKLKKRLKARFELRVCDDTSAEATERRNRRTMGVMQEIEMAPLAGTGVRTTTMGTGTGASPSPPFVPAREGASSPLLNDLSP